MEIRATALPDVKLIIPQLFEDERGFFFEAWHAERFREAGLPDRFLQLNHSRSKRNALRGLHFQVTHPQGKLVRVLSGSILDVAVDLRPGSPDYASWSSVELNDQNRHQLYLPHGFAHGFYVLSRQAEVEYLTTDIYDPAGERSLLWNDPAIGIVWPTTTPRLSPKDSSAPRLEELASELEVFRLDR
ncbi:MAG: dTDP-4-dehydrorhamnose 3,5-epimerase [Candidatus Delongbacteria bacterium]|nr:dTDP-4-dehydrorhamnose 3,5-epimerase [Candidatus Delongbacteria bacterium]